MAEPVLSGFSKRAAVGSAVQPCPLTWIEIALLDESDQPVPGEPYRIETVDGVIHEGRLDPVGKARVEGIVRGTCKISFPRLDREAWEPIS